MITLIKKSLAAVGWVLLWLLCYLLKEVVLIGLVLLLIVAFLVWLFVPDY